MTPRRQRVARPSQLPWAKPRFGRRGAYLLSFGAVYILLGVAWLTTPAPPPALHPTYEVLLAIAPYKTWGWTWIGVGAGAIAASKATVDAWGFALIIAMTSLWAGCILLAQFVGVPSPRAWLGAVLYLGLAVAHFVVAGWQETNGR